MTSLLLLAFVTAQFEFSSGISFLQAAAGQGGAVSSTATPSTLTARFIPLSLGASEPQTGPGVEAGTWHVEICNLGSEDRLVPRALIMETVSLRYLPPEFVAPLLSQRTGLNKKNILKNILKYSAMAGGLAAAVAGNQEWAVGTLIFGNMIEYGPKLAESIPPTVYSLPNPLPAEVLIRSGSCPEYNFLATKIRGAAVMGPFPIREVSRH